MGPSNYVCRDSTTAADECLITVQRTDSTMRTVQSQMCQLLHMNGLNIEGSAAKASSRSGSNWLLPADGCHRIPPQDRACGAAAGAAAARRPGWQTPGSPRRCRSARPPRPGSARAAAARRMPGRWTAGTPPSSLSCPAAHPCIGDTTKRTDTLACRLGAVLHIGGRLQGSRSALTCLQRHITHGAVCDSNQNSYNSRGYPGSSGKWHLKDYALQGSPCADVAA